MGLLGENYREISMRAAIFHKLPPKLSRFNVKNSVRAAIAADYKIKVA